MMVAPAFFEQFTKKWPLIWKAIGSAVVVIGGIITIWKNWPQTPPPHATIPTVHLAARMTHEQYLRDKLFLQAADVAHDPSAPIPPQQEGLVYYYTVDILGSGLYRIGYELLDKNNNLSRGWTDVRSIIVRKRNTDPQAFWVPLLQNVAKVKVYIAPENAPPPFLAVQDAE